MTQRANLLAILFICKSLHGQSQPSASHQSVARLYEQALTLSTTSPPKSYQTIDSILLLSPKSEFALKALLLQSDLYCDDNRYSDALTSLKQTSLFTSQKKFASYVGEILFRKGTVYKALSNDSAQACFEEAFLVFSILPDSVQMAKCLTRISYLQMEKGNYLAAMDYLNKVDQLTPPGVNLNRLNLLINQMHTFSSVGLDTRAVALSKKMMHIIKKLPPNAIDVNVLPAYGNICDAYLNLNKPDSARYYAQIAMNTLDSIPSNSAFWLTMASISLALDSPSVALRYIQHFQVKPDYKIWSIQKQSILLKIYQKLNDQPSANRIAREIISQIPAIPRKAVMMKIYRIVESAYTQLGNQTMAYVYSQNFFNVYQEVYNQKQLSDLLDKDFEEALKQQRKQSELEANLLKATIDYHQQQRLGLLVGSLLLLVIIILLWIRYRYIQQFNQSLNKIVRDRTLELTIKNQQLSEYAFINAHKLRGPLARIMGLLYIYKMKDSEMETETVMGLMAKETESLDSIVRSITEAIEEKRVFDRNDI